MDPSGTLYVQSGLGSDREGEVRIKKVSDVVCQVCGTRILPTSEVTYSSNTPVHHKVLVYTGTLVGLGLPGETGELVPQTRKIPRSDIPRREQ